MEEYWKRIWKTRYFWSHLARCELKSRFRRSKLGLLWTVFQPLILTLIMAFVFSTIFQQTLGDYAVYILSGIVVWDLMTGSVVAGGSSILSAEQYVRQFNHPITIYSLRSAVLNIITFCIEAIALALWILAIRPANIMLWLVTFPLTVVLFFMLAWPLTTIAGYSNCKYRDYPQIMMLVMQAFWYVSPVMFQRQMFESNPNLRWFYHHNPITHILNLIRNPFLYGELPSLLDYFYTLFTIIIFTLWAYQINKKNEKKIIFYL